MRHFMYRQIRRLVIALPIVGAVGVGMYLVMSNPGPQKESDLEKRRAVRVIDAPSVDLVPRAGGFGTAEPTRVWEAVAQVKGSVVQIHPRLKAGETIEAGSTLLRIDPSEYRLTVARLEANIDETKARLNELTREKENTKRLLDVEKRSLKLARRALERKRSLLEKEAIAPDAVDREQRTYLQQKEKVQQLDNSLSLIPARIKTLEATLAAQKSEWERAKIDLATTTVKAPFDCPISDVSIERDQFLRAGQSLFKVHGTGSTEIEVRFRLDQLRRLVGRDKREHFSREWGRRRSTNCSRT